MFGSSPHHHHGRALRLGRLVVFIALLLLARGQLVTAAERPPSIVLIVADDLGYGDLGCFGSKTCKTPSLDHMAAEGMKFTSFYVAQAVCSASRAAFMTGCYANRVGLFGALNHSSREGIHPVETLIPEICKERSYATAIFGKWHLGQPALFNPLRHGFDEFLGIPYSNDNSKFHLSVKNMPPLPLMEGGRVVEEDPDQSQFTRRFTERAVAFVEKNKERPFFLYVPHVMPHVPIFASEPFKGKSGASLYADVVQELDWSVGEVLAALKRCGIDNKTLVIFFSDNGPFLSYGNHAGSAGALREGKLTTFEGGVRVPCIMRWPGTIPASRECSAPVMAIDLLPTIAEVIGGPHPKQKIDGRSLRALLAGAAAAQSPHEALFFYAGAELQSARMGRWKYHFAHRYITVDGEPGRDGKPAAFGQLKPKSISESGLEGIASRHGYRIESVDASLFDLESDIGERRNVAEAHPDVVTRIEKLAARIRLELGDSLQKVAGAEVRPAGKAE